MPDLGRVVAGVRCRDVLAALPDYVDGTLDPEMLRRVRAHVAECDLCDKFGGEYAAVVEALRAVRAADAGDGLVQGRLLRRLAAEWEGQGR